MKKGLKITLIIIATPIVLFALFLLIFTILDYNPKPIIPLKVEGNAPYTKLPDTFTILTWNIGYAGLGKEADFFMDGGTHSLPANKSIVEKHIKNITNFLASNDVDFYLIQEVDVNSKRSFHINEYDKIKNTLQNKEYVFATNYKVLFVPVPLSAPLGKVKAGNMTISNYKIENATRYSFPGNYPWPVKLFQLDRCFLVTEIKLKNKDNKLILINTHNSAFDKGGFLRKKQLAFLKEFITNEYKKGNYVIVGGDWNHTLPGVDNNYFPHKQGTPDWVIQFPSDWTPYGWKWGVDTQCPTTRSDDVPYTKGYNFLTTIDGFLVSPNIDIISVKGVNLEFEDSDHNPVLIKLKLK